MTGIPAGTWDMIASNPPYIGAVDPHLQEGDLRFEPTSALSPGVDGQSALRTIVGGARERLAPGGWLVVEHGYDQSDAVQALFRRRRIFRRRSALRDLAGIPRVVAGHRVARVTRRSRTRHVRAFPPTVAATA